MTMPDGYSAAVTLQVFAGGVTLGLSHVGPSAFVVRDACDPIPAGDAELLVSIDGHAEKASVFLPQGIEGPGVSVPYF